MVKSKLHIATYQREVYDGVSVAQHLHNDLPNFDESVVIRLGGSMPYKDYTIHVNSQEAVLNSINKKRQKELLLAAQIPTQPLLDMAVYPCVVKATERSGGTSVFVVKNHHELRTAKAKCNDNFLIEPLFNTTSEYRLHCTKKECFFAVRKIKRNPEDIIVTRENHFNKRDFLKPRRWKEIQEACVKAMSVLDLDIACFDVLYDSSNDLHHQFVISEANTNPELLHNTYNAYLPKFIEIVNEKIAKLREKKPKIVQDAKKAAPVKNEELAQKLSIEQRLSAVKALVTNNIQFDGKRIVIEL